MDENILIFEQFANILENSPIPVIPYIGRGESDCGGRICNPPACHVEITYVKKGHYQNFRVGNKFFDLKENHISFYNVHFGNYSDFTEGVKSWCAVFDISRIYDFPDLAEIPFFVAAPVNNGKRIEHVFEEATVRCNIMDSQTYLDGPVIYDPLNPNDTELKRRLGIKASILQLLWTIIDELPESSESSNPKSWSDIKKIQQFVATNFYRTDLCLEDMAIAANLSSSYTGYLFKKLMNTTPMRYLKQYRINQASMLLARTKRPVGEIAMHVGFADSLHFSREFKLQTGLCPKEFRKSAPHP